MHSSPHAPQAVTLDQLRADIGAAVGDESAVDAAAGDLIACGLDSVKVMVLASRWRAAGIEVRYADLMERPTLPQWLDLLSANQGHAVRPVQDATSGADDGEPFDLATMQHAYWVGRDENMVLGGVATHFYAEFDGARIERDRLDRAVAALLDRHAMLRAAILDDGRQRILPRSPWSGVTVHDLRASSESSVAASLAETRDRLSHRRFDVAAGEVFDVALSLLPDGTARLHLNIDMLVADALSFRIILNDLADLYADPEAVLPAIDYSFRRYLTDRAAAPDTGYDDAARYWHERVDGMPGPPGLPTVGRHLPEHRVTRRFHWLSPQTRSALGERARANGVTVSMMFAAAFAEVVAAWSAEPDFVLNVPLFNRELIHPDVANLVGDFTNLLIVEVHAGGPSFAASAKAVQARVTADAAHSACSGLEVLRALGRARGGQAIAPVVFTSAIGLGELFTPKVRSSFGAAGWNISQAPQVWLDHQVTEHDGGLLLNWDVVEDLFPHGVLDDMFAAYLRLLDWLGEPGADWARPVPDLLSTATRQQRARINSTAGPQRNTVLHSGFLDIAAREPDRVALVTDEDTWSYGELAGRAARVAGLLRAHGLRRGDVVAVTLPKGPAQIEAVLGVLCAGGVFLPVGVDLPAARRAAIHRVSGARLVLADGPDAVSDDTVEVLAIGAAGSVSPVAAIVADPDELAYVIYTSGSTGEPKCVEMTHRAAMNTVEDIGDRAAIGPDSRGFALSALDHDWAVYDIFAFLSSGGSLVMVEQDAQRDAHRWLDLLRAHEVTVWTSVPALLDMLLVAAQAQEVDLPLRLAMVGGDWVGLDLYSRLTSAAPGSRLVALGGATEVGIHSTWHEITEVPTHWRSVPYGDPLRNQRTRVVDRAGADRPDLVPGELLLGGVGVGPGYRGDPERTAQRFCTHDDVRWYRTGDLARYLPDGTLEFLGRTDSQVKILGHRIELGDIAAMLLTHPDVSRAVATTTADSPPLLVAAVTGDTGLDVAELRAFLADRLPEYMVPRRIMALGALPLTANGKIDRGVVTALFTRDTDRSPARPQAPVGAAETAVATMWGQLLNRDVVDRDDDFFALGGNSLLATKLVAGLRTAGYPRVPLSDLFQRPTLRAFAAGLVEDGAAPAPSTLVSRPQERYEPFPATDVQRAYWLGRGAEFTLGGVGSHWYWEFTGTGLDVDRLRRAWNAVIARHDMMRAIFDDDGRQRVLPEVPELDVEVIDVASELRERMAHRVYEPDTWPLFDLRVAAAEDGTTTVGISMDFLTLDALSIMVVVGDLIELYENPAAELPPIGVSYRDCVLAGPADPGQLDRAKQYWRDRVAELPLGPRLPLACEPQALGVPRFTRREHRLAPEGWRALTRQAAAHGVTPSTVVATAFATIVGHWAAEPSFTLNFTLFDRPDLHPDVYRVVGDFTSLLLVANQPEPGEGFTDAVRRIQARVWADMEHSSYSGVSVLRDLARHHQRMDVPVPVVFTSTIGVSAVTDRPFSLHTPFGDYAGGLSQTPQVWLDHQVTEHDGGLLLNWDAIEDLFADGVLDAMFQAYRDLLDRLAAPETDWSAAVRLALPENQERLRRQVNDTTVATPDRLLHKGFLDQVERAPDRVALAWGAAETMSYGDLHGRAAQVAGALRGVGVQPGDRVAVSVPRGADQVAAVLGALYAGAVYVPIGVDQPPARRERMLRIAEIRAVLVDGYTDVPVHDDLAVVEMAGLADAAPVDSPHGTHPADSAYIIFTSGSTGEPKGVEISHRSAWNTVADINERFGIGEDDRVLTVSSVDFDLSVYDIFGLLAVGGALVLVEESARADAVAWRTSIDTHRVTVWNSAPALLDMLTTTTAGPDPVTLRIALVSGDWVGLDLPGRLAAHTGGRCALVALGGATEASIWSNHFEVGDVPGHWASIPYGHPLRNQRFRVVADGLDRPDWVPGELWIGGQGVAVGYHGDRETTAQRFVTDGGERWYRTGDLGRYWPDGTLEFLGRTDHQVKVRGHRIELGEVEAALRRHPGVDRAVALVTSGVRRLVAAVVPADGTGQVDVDDLRGHVARYLPEHMVPARIAVLDRIPLTANGKVDRRAIELVVSEVDSDVAEPPSGELEVAIAKLWTDLLGCATLRREESFFALGGDSLLATRLVERSRHELGVDLSLRDLMTAPTVAAQARLVATRTAVPAMGYEEGEL